MDRGDELWLPDGRVMPYRRVQEPPIRRRARAFAVRPPREPVVARRRPAPPGGERGRHLDIVV